LGNHHQHETNKHKYQILYLGQSNTGYKSELEEEWLERIPTERGLRVLVGSRLSRSQQCVLAAKGANCILGAPNSMARQSREDYSALFRTGAA